MYSGMKGLLDSAKVKAEKNKGEKEKEYQEFFNQGAKSFKTGIAKKDQGALKLAGDFMYKAIQCTRKYAEPFFVLAYIFYLAENVELARTYMKTAEEINPTLNGLAELRKLLY
jgi:hypothetical protein